MDSYRRYSDQLRLLLVTVSVALMLVTIIACERPNQPSVSASVAVGAASTATQILDPLAATKQAFDDLYETRLDQMRTAAVLSHVPTHVPGPPPTDTPGVPPTDTPALGIRFCATPARPQFYSFKNCWGGIVNGQYLYAAVGGETRQWVVNGKGGPSGWVGDDTQGVIMLNVPNDQAYLYYTPIKIGQIGILAANGAQLTLAPVNPNDRRYLLNSPTIIFDVATRRFISASGTPIPTTPVPTPAP